MLRLKELLWGTPKEIQADHRYAQLINKHNLTSKQKAELKEAKGLSRGLFLRRATTILVGISLAAGGGTSIFTLIDADNPSLDLLDFEKKHQNLLLRPNEKSLREDWISKIAQLLIKNTNFSGREEDLTSNFFFAFSTAEYFGKYQSLPGSEDPRTIVFTNGATVFNENGVSGTVISTAKIIAALGGTNYNPVRVVGCVCAHEMGHRTILKPRILEIPFILPGSNGTLEATKILGFKLNGFDVANPQRHLNFLEPLDEVAAELHAQRTYQEAYLTPGSPVREAPILLSRMKELLNFINMPQESLISYQRENDPFGFLTELSLRTGARLDSRSQVLHGIDISLTALNGDIEGAKKFINNPPQSN